MNMDSINKWLTLAANVGVMAGIVFLGVEIQQNSALNEVTLYQGLMRDMNNINLMRIENPQFGSVLAKASGDEELSTSETIQINGFAMYIFNLGDMAFKQYEKGLMSEADLKETLDPIRFWANSISVVNNRWISIASTGVFDENYYNYVTENIINN